MIRRAFTLQLEPGALARYREHHDNIWPELVAEIRDADAWDRLWHTDVHDRSSELVKPLMAFNAEGIVDASDLTEIFHLETGAAE